MTLRELKYVIYGEDKMGSTLNKISGAGAKAESALNGVNNKITKLDGAQTKAASSGAAYSGVLNKAASAAASMINPVTVASLAVTGLAAVFSRGIKEISGFQLEFRKLENINLDKSRAEISKLRNDILSLSGMEGFNSVATSQAYFDVQSLTGSYGFDNEQLLKKQGNFAMAYGADFNKYISGTGIAMKNYGFGNDKLDEFNKSSMGLVATAKITYDKLAEVMPVYAGAASAANQNFDSANKLMAIMTTKSKSPDEAATLTKSAFTDLFKESSQKSFKAVGISLYDMYGNAKQVDKIMLELNAKFSDAKSAKAMDELRNKFSGSEGINMLLSAASDKSGALLKSFQDFDKAGKNLQKGLDTMNNDINTINTKINNKLTTAWTELGKSILPTWIKIKELILSSVDGLSGIFQYGNMAYGIASGNANRSAYDWRNKIMDSESKVVGNAGNMSYQDFQKTKTYYQSKYDEAYGTLQGKNKTTVQIKDASERMKMYQSLLLSLTKNYGVKPAGTTGEPVITADEAGGAAGSGINSMLAGISGGGNRNVTVSINKMIENFTIETNNFSDAPEKIKAELEATLVRAVAGAEQMISQ